MLRAIGPALRSGASSARWCSSSLLSAAAIALFYGAGLMYGRHTHLSMVEYWRWWVVHLWVEGFFEVFATTVIAFLFARLQLVTSAAGRRGVVAGGDDLPRRRHHRHESPSVLLRHADGGARLGLHVQRARGRAAAVGRLHGHGTTCSTSRSRRGSRKYRWPVYFFIAVAFWNLVGAGLFGFMINPPIALYYMQGLNTTPVHGHGALFGVYGMLGIGLTLLCLRALTADRSGGKVCSRSRSGP